jgi:hypothetical protein
MRTCRRHGLVEYHRYKNGADTCTAAADACVLLCANCHGEVEAGLVPSPPPQARFGGSYGEWVARDSNPDLAD